MNHIATYAALGLLNAGTFCAQAEFPADQPVKAGKSQSSLAPGQGRTTGNVKAGAVPAAVNKGNEEKTGYVITAKGPAPGEIRMTAGSLVEEDFSAISTALQQGKVFRTRKVGDSANGGGKEHVSPAKAGAAEADREGTGGKAVYSITAVEGTVPGEMNIRVAPKQAGASPKAPGRAVAEQDDRAVVQMALLLDTSSSMDGLINQARTYLWKIVNDMTLARRNGRLPSIRIALYEYGNDRLSSRDAWIRQVLPFTDDLDKVSEELFKLKTFGGTECCGAVIDRAVKELKWNTDDPHALKLVFIAGNESFNQGGVPYAKAIARGLERGITVNTIHCGDAGDSDTLLWKDGARKGDGSFFNIHHHAAPPDPETPFDKELAGLSSSLNATYLAYGSPAVQAERLEKQANQDTLAQELSPAASVGRAAVKANKAAYSNASWDLVDLYERKGGQALGQVGSSGRLPRELEGKTAEEVEAAVKKKAEERAALQKKVRELNARRNEWLAKWKQQNASRDAGPNTLEDAIGRAIRQQASKKQFSFVEENETTGKDSPMNDRVKK